MSDQIFRKTSPDAIWLDRLKETLAVDLAIAMKQGGGDGIAPPATFH